MINGIINSQAFRRSRRVESGIGGNQDESGQARTRFCSFSY